MVGNSSNCRKCLSAGEGVENWPRGNKCGWVLGYWRKGGRGVCHLLHLGCVVDLPCRAATSESSLMHVRDRGNCSQPHTSLKGESCLLFQCVLVAVWFPCFYFNFHNWQLQKWLWKTVRFKCGHLLPKCPGYFRNPTLFPSELFRRTSSERVQEIGSCLSQLLQRSLFVRGVVPSVCE